MKSCIAEAAATTHETIFIIDHSAFLVNHDGSARMDDEGDNLFKFVLDT